jgi:hypothetical protein
MIEHPTKKAESMSPISEKRRFERVSFKREVEIFPVFPSYSEEFPDSPLSGLSKDIGGGGIAFKTDKSLRAGSFLKLRFELEKDQMVETFGKIVWAKGNLFGLSFDSMNAFPSQQS